MSHPVILLADDHAVVRRGLKNILLEQFPSATFIEAESGHQVVQLASENPVDVIILDLSMPEGGGMEALTEIRKLKSGLPILVMSAHSEEQYGVRVIKAGASGFLNKESAPKELVTAVRQILQRGRYVSASLADKLANHIQHPEQGLLHETLSDREFEILRMIGMGKSVTQIAGELHLSDKTISTYRARVLEKLHLETTAELIHYCLKNSLVT